MSIIHLFYMDMPDQCRDTKQITDSVKIIYQMEQEFFPYVKIDFLINYNSNKGIEKTGGVIITTKNERIEKPFHFINKNEIKQLRKILWDLLHKNKNIPNYNDRDMGYTNPNNVIDNWKEAAKRNVENNCKPIIKDIIVEGLSKAMYIHWSYLNKEIPPLTKENCLKMRQQECYDNFPTGSQLFGRCMDEVQWLCDNGVPNTMVDIKNKQVATIRKYFYDYLKQNNLRVNKKMFDDIMMSGMFDDLGNRAGNKANVSQLKNYLDDKLSENDYYLQYVEGFGEVGYPIYYYILAIIILILLCYFMKN